MTDKHLADILGSGWAFPVGVDARGRIALARQEDDIRQAILMILLTPKGQRVMRPEFGCQIHDLLFAPNDATTAGLAAYYVQDALAMWEPRIRVLDVDARPDADDPARLLIHIRYEVLATYDQRSLVFPFYRIPGEPGALPAAAESISR
jgi:phage baseplate assembly protein W